MLLVCLAFSQAKLSRQRKEKLQLRVRADPVSSENDPELVFDGLPGEVEYEVDLSDQVNRPHSLASRLVDTWSHSILPK